MMSEKTHPDLSGVAETLLITLYIRALESKRPDALLIDPKAVDLVNKMEYDFSRFTRMKIDEDDKVTIILRNREFDRYARDFMVRNPNGVIIHIGCGLDDRFERVDNGKVDWYDLDLPEVIDLRRNLIGNESQRYHFLSESVFESSWLDKVSKHNPRPFLFLAEGVFMYFEEKQVRALVLALRDHFPGAELVCDAFSPFIVRANNLRFRLFRSKISARYSWGLKNGKDVERWGSEITMLDEWFPLNQPEPRLAHIQWMRHVPLFAKVIGIYHYRLGEVPN